MWQVELLQISVVVTEKEQIPALKSICSIVRGKQNIIPIINKAEVFDILWALMSAFDKLPQICLTGIVPSFSLS